MSDWIERFSLQGRTALVTGASKGIGFEICRVFADAGADIVATARDQSGLQSVVEAVQERGRKCQTFQCELGDPEAIESLCSDVLANVSQVDILVNNAGVARVAPAAELSLQDWDDTMAVNVRAPFLLAQKLAPPMRERQWGKIINISSQAGVVALDDHVAYSASKAALNAVTRGLMAEWARYNIQVNSICPTIILTEMGQQVWGQPEKGAPMLAKTPLGRFGETVEVADMALYLASSASALVNGETLMIEGGFSAI